jgi:hypothetical protein
VGQSRFRQIERVAQRSFILLDNGRLEEKGAAMHVITLSPSDLAIAALLILALAGLSRRLRSVPSDNC